MFNKILIAHRVVDRTFTDPVRRWQQAVAGGRQPACLGCALMVLKMRRRLDVRRVGRTRPAFGDVRCVMTARFEGLRDLRGHRQ